MSSSLDRALDELNTLEDQVPADDANDDEHHGGEGSEPCSTAADAAAAAAGGNGGIATIPEDGAVPTGPQKRSGFARLTDSLRRLRGNPKYRFSGHVVASAVTASAATASAATAAAERAASDTQRGDSDAATTTAVRTVAFQAPPEAKDASGATAAASASAEPAASDGRRVVKRLDVRKGAGRRETMIHRKFGYRYARAAAVRLAAHRCAGALTTCAPCTRRARAHARSVEDGRAANAPKGAPLREQLALEDAEDKLRWYYRYFLGKVHQNHIAYHDSKEPYVISAVCTSEDNNDTLQYRLLLWRRDGCERVCLPYQPKKELTVHEMMRVFGIKGSKPLEVSHPDLQKDLLLLEEQEGTVNFKFGVIYAKQGDVTDDEMLSNEHGSAEFDRFLALLGDKIELNGWTKFRGGLDVKTGTTGTYSVWTEYLGHQIMFHVSVLLPYSCDNAQQLERKRHLGNDIVNIIFQDGEGDSLFDPTSIKSQFNHVFAVVRYDKEQHAYRLSVSSREDVPVYGPSLPNPAIFTDPQLFRDFLLIKLMNGEKSCYGAPVFRKKMQRTLEVLLTEICNKYTKKDAPHLRDRLSRVSLVDELQEPQVRQAFETVGSQLRASKIESGLAPTPSNEVRARPAARMRLTTVAESADQREGACARAGPCCVRAGHRGRELWPRRAQHMRVRRPAAGGHHDRCLSNACRR